MQDGVSGAPVCRDALHEAAQTEQEDTATGHRIQQRPLEGLQVTHPQPAFMSPHLTGASILRGALGEQSPTFFKVGG